MDKRSKLTWVPDKSIQTIFLDVDSTLCSIEGIDELAKQQGVGPEVTAITQRCMSQTGMSSEAYRQRLEIVQPSLNQLNDLGNLYCQTLTTSAQTIIPCLTQLNKTIFLLSAGMRPALVPLAKFLSIPERHVLGVDIQFNADGKFDSFDHLSPIIQANGKSVVIKEQNADCESSVMVGDGLSDLETQAVVKRFIGFGGHQLRPQVLNQSNFFITVPDLAGLLPLVLTKDEVNQLSGEALNIYKAGLKAIEQKQIIIKESDHV